MPTTGTYFGLKQDAWYDARKDFPQATDAALLYLRKLYKRFDNDWLLAIASYNAGGGTVARAIRKNLEQNKPVDFWSLDLPAETETYVPRLLALAKVVGHAKQYGLTLPDIHYQAHFATVRIERQLDLDMAARLAGMSTEELLELNPGFKRWATHPNTPHDLMLPVEKADDFSEKLSRLPAEQWVRIRRHHIIPGDNLGRIARKYGVSIKDLKQANRLHNSNIRAGDDLIIPAADRSSIALSGRTKGAPHNRKVQYQVVKGDSLYRIARQFSVQVSDLKKWNSLNGTYIKPGQELTVLVN
jgi:membrane-bound lytic murein transglycosylase D